MVSSRSAGLVASEHGRQLVGVSIYGFVLLGLWLYHRAERYARIHGLLGRF